MSCIRDIYESFKDLCVDCIFCKEEENINRERRSIRSKRRHNKSTQTEMNNFNNISNESIVEPGSIIN